MVVIVAVLAAGPISDGVVVSGVAMGLVVVTMAVGLVVVTMAVGLLIVTMVMLTVAAPVVLLSHLCMGVLRVVARTAMSMSWHHHRWLVSDRGMRVAMRMAMVPASSVAVVVAEDAHEN